MKETEVNDRNWEVGDRVSLPSVVWPMHQPHSEHEGKEGTITGSEPISGYKIDTPVITLDDGTVLKGYDCWWEFIGKSKGERQ